MKKKILLLLIISLFIIFPVKAEEQIIEEQININDIPITVSGIQNKTYTGKRITQNLKIFTSEQTLEENKDYELSYSYNLNAGTAKINIQGIGNYTGTKVVTFKIYRRNLSTVSISSIKNQVYSGKYKKPLPTLSYDGTKLVRNSNYKLTYKNNKKIGTATVSITGIGNYTGTRKITFKIIPKTPTLKSAKLSKGKITLKWNKITNATGYKIYKSTNGGSYKLYKTIASNKKTSYTTGKISYGTYRFKVRAYKKVGQKIYYGNYSNIKKIERKTINQRYSELYDKYYHSMNWYTDYILETRTLVDGITLTDLEEEYSNNVLYIYQTYGGSYETFEYWYWALWDFYLSCEDYLMDHGIYIG